MSVNETNDYDVNLEYDDDYALLDENTKRILRESKEIVTSSSRVSLSLFFFVF